MNRHITRHTVYITEFIYGLLVVVVTTHTSLRADRSHLLPTTIIGTSLQCLTLFTVSLNRLSSLKLLFSVTEYTIRNPSPPLMYCSLIAVNSSYKEREGKERGGEERERERERERVVLKPY